MAVQSHGYDIVMLVLNDVAYDARVRREAAALAGGGWRVLVVGTQRAGGTLPQRETLNGFDILRVNYGRFGSRKWWPWRWIRHGLQAVQIIWVLRGIPARAYHAHDLPALILVSLVRGLQRNPPALVYDSHELYLFMALYKSSLSQRWHRLTRPAFMRLERYLCRRADAAITPSESYARLLAKWYDVPRPIVVWNVSDPVRENERAPVDLRKTTGDRRFIVHTGTITQNGRCLTELVESLCYLPEDVALVFLGGSPGARQGEAQELMQLVQRLDLGARVFLVPPVSPEQVPATIRTGQAAAVLLRSDYWSVRASLPNKFFEALAAGLPVVASAQYTLARVVRAFELGEVCTTEPEAIAAAFNRLLDPERQAYYRARVVEAQQVLNWQNEARKLKSIYERVLRE
jgi:glycogen(starch) synthase